MNYVDWYSNHCMHSLLELVTPEEFEQRFYAHNTGSPTGDARQHEIRVKAGTLHRPSRKAFVYW